MDEKEYQEMFARLSTDLDEIGLEKLLRQAREMFEGMKAYVNPVEAVWLISRLKGTPILDQVLETLNKDDDQQKIADLLSEAFTLAYLLYSLSDARYLRKLFKDGEKDEISKS